MSPHKIEVLPSLAALPAYGISANGFLPAEPPLRKLPGGYYQPWETIVADLPNLIETQHIRERIDQLPVLTTSRLESEAEWQRAYSILAVMAQGYVWTGPEPSQVRAVKYPSVEDDNTDVPKAFTSCHHDTFSVSLRATRSPSDRNIRCPKSVELDAYRRKARLDQA